MHRHGTQSCWRCHAGISFYFLHRGIFYSLSQPTATPSDSAGPPAISGLDGYRQNMLTGGVSEDTANFLRSHSWRKGTAGAYNSAWKQWSSWCGQQKVDPFCFTVASIADYLTEVFKRVEVTTPLTFTDQRFLPFKSLLMVLRWGNMISFAESLTPALMLGHHSLGML